MDFAAVNRQIDELESRIGTPLELSPGEQLFVGVDLGTAYIVVVVVNAEREPVACALEFAQVVRDGLVVDYTGATRIVRKLVQQLEERLGRELTVAAIAVPPGTGERECATHRHVVEGAGLTVTSVLDEPTAALDPLAEADLYQKYASETKEKTSVFISHRLGSTQFCDRVVYMDGGRIAEVGTHQELLVQGGAYANLFQIQSSWYTDEKEAK